MHSGWRSDRGSAAAEFVLVGTLLTVTTLSVLQLGLALFVRNTVVDAASEGARFGALVGNTPADGAQRAADLITTALGPSYATDVSGAVDDFLGAPFGGRDRARAAAAHRAHRPRRRNRGERPCGARSARVTR